ncbi:MAG TPA: hypothetical protein VIS94_13375 [Desulfomonilia bacterium]
MNHVLPLRNVHVRQPILLLKKSPDYDGALTYIQKIKGGKDVYFFPNSTDKPIDTQVVLHGSKAFRIWNPQTGEPQEAEFTIGETAIQPTTTVHLALPVTALFYVQEQSSVIDPPIVL